MSSPPASDLRAVSRGVNATPDLERSSHPTSGHSHSTAAGHEHVVHFYEDDDHLGRAVARYLAEGAHAGDELLVIATGDHWRAIRSRLEAEDRKIDADAIRVLDAHATLDRFMRNGEPDAELFDRVIGGAIADVMNGGARRLRAYGEMVDVLWRAGERRAAIRLEELWNGLLQRHRFRLFCAYSMANFYKEPADLESVLGTHTRVVFDEVHAANENGSGFGAHAAQRLSAEIAHRREIEAALRDSIAEVRSREEDVRRSEELLRDFVDNAAIGLHRVGADGTILWANRAELEMLGYAEAEYVGRSIVDFHVDRAVIEDVLARLRTGETLHDRPVRLRAKDGSIRHVLLSSSAYRKNGEFIHTRCFSLDVTARRSLESFRDETVARGEKLLRITGAIANAVTDDQVFAALVDDVADAVGASSAGLWLLDPRHRVARLVRTRGYQPQTEKHLDGLAIDGGPSLPILDCIRNGEAVWIDSQAILLERYPHLKSYTTQDRVYGVVCLPLVSDGRVLGALGLTIEGTEGISDEQREFLQLVALYASQAVERLRLYRETVETQVRAEQLYRFAQSVVAADRVEIVYEAALSAIETALGTRRAAILTCDENRVMRFRAWRHLSDEYRAAVEGHSPWPPDAIAPEPVLVPDAANDPALAGYRALFASEGIGALAFVPIVSRQRLLGKFMVYHDDPHTFAAHEIETAQAIANHLGSVMTRFAVIGRLEETIRSNELFAGALAHDLRNPLGAIMTAAKVALMQREGEDGPEARDPRPLSRILSSGRRVANMIDQLLDFTRARSGGGIAIDPHPSNLADLCAQAIEELELGHPEWKIRRVAIGDLSGAWDPDRLLQVISNLVANAGQHGTRGGEIELTLDGTHTDRVELRVHNEGAIPAKLLPHLFDPFRGTHHRREQSQGLVLGLFIVREIARAHGGEVNVHSTEAEGTTLRIELPRESVARKPLDGSPLSSPPLG